MSTSAYTCVCTHVLPRPQALQSMQGHFLFLLSAPSWTSLFSSEYHTAQVHGGPAVGQIGGVGHAGGDETDRGFTHRLAVPFCALPCTSPKSQVPPSPLPS